MNEHNIQNNFQSILLFKYNVKKQFHSSLKGSTKKETEQMFWLNTQIVGYSQCVHCYIII